MLTHWGDALFCLWAVLLSARALFLFLSDGFVRYAVNDYNLRYHQDEPAAEKGLSDHFGFLSLFSLLTALLVFGVLQLFPLSGAWLFDIGVDRLEQYGLPMLVAAYLLVCGFQNGQRLMASTQEARGFVRYNLQFESALVSAEIVLLSLLLHGNAFFSRVVWADILLIAVASGGYQWALFRQLRLPDLFSPRSISRGARAFIRAGRLYLGNFFEKLSTDGLVLLLSLFRFPKTTIAVFAAFRTMVNAPLLAQNLLLNSYTPRLQQLFALKEVVLLRRLLLLARVYLGLLLLAGMIICIPVYQPVFLRWTQGSLPFDTSFFTGMLLWCVWSIYGNGYLFVLKGLNLLREFWTTMALRCCLLLAGFFCCAGDARYLVLVLWSTEFLVSGLLLPHWLRRFWKRNAVPFSFMADTVLLLIHGLAAFLLYYFLY